MALTLAEIESANLTTGSTTWVSASFNVSAGDLIVLMEVHNTGTDATACADSSANNYTKETSSAQSTLIDGSQWAFYYSGAASGLTVTLTYAASTAGRFVKLLRVQGAGASFIDTVTAGGTGGVAVKSAHSTGVTAAPGSMTPTSADLIIALAGYKSATAVTTPPSGYTQIGSDINNATRVVSLSAYYSVQSSPAAENPSWTIPSVEWVAMQIGIVAGAVTKSLVVPSLAQTLHYTRR